jgi:CelD/BcsL family acetyltransferase involved in cellulose biosynthesis
LASEATVDQFFGDLVRIHQEHWTSQGKPGCFASSRFLEFHQLLARQWIPAGHAVLARLTHEDQPVAVIYGFISGSKFDFYQSGTRRLPPGSLSSPGNLANLLLMKRLLDRGITRYDFLRGSSHYKERLSTESIRLFNLHVWRPTVRAAFYWTSLLVRKSPRRMIRGIRGMTRTPSEGICLHEK